jgi:hypothetical protein
MDSEHLLGTGTKLSENKTHTFFLKQIKKQFGEKRSTVGSHRNDDYLLKNTSYWIGCKLH